MSLFSVFNTLEVKSGVDFPFFSPGRPPSRYIESSDKQSFFFPLIISTSWTAVSALFRDLMSLSALNFFLIFFSMRVVRFLRFNSLPLTTIAEAFPSYPTNGGRQCDFSLSFRVVCPSRSDAFFCASLCWLRWPHTCFSPQPPSSA